MRINVQHIFVFLLLIILLGCGRTQVKKVAKKQAYRDGFEIILCSNSNYKTAKNYALKAGATLLATDKTVTATLSTKNIHDIEQLIGNLNRKNKSTYPLVYIDIKKTEDKEIIDLSYHYSNSTYHYCYQVEHNKITPLWSSYRGKKVIYK